MNANLTILYAERHKKLIPILVNQLEKFNLRTVGFNDGIPDSTIQYYSSGLAEYSDLLHKVDAVILFCAENQFFVDSFRDNISKLLTATKERDKQIFVITDDIYNHLLRFGSASNYGHIAQEIFSNVCLIELQDGWIGHSMIRAACRVFDQLNNQNEKNILYDKLWNFQKMSYGLGILNTLSELIILQAKELHNYPSNHKNRKQLYKEIYRLLLAMYKNSTGEFSIEGRSVANKQISALSQVEMLLTEEEFLKNDLYYSALALSYIYFSAFIKHDCVEWLTNDDVHLLLEESRRESWCRQQQPFYEIITNARRHKDYQILLEEKYMPDEIEMIQNVENTLITSLVSDGHNVYRKINGVYSDPVIIPKDFILNEMTDEERLLESIAGLIRKSLQLFDEISNKEKALELLRCLKTSYERLKNYCEIVGSKRVAAECVTRLSEISNKLERYYNEDSDNGKAEKGLRTLLGLKLPEPDEYDVFLSYKHEDKDIATSCCHFLKEQHIHPFLDYAVLPELSNSDYEEAIMESLDHSRHFIVILTKLEYLKSHWIRLEMKTFEHEMAEGRKPEANMILLVSDSVYNSIVETNKKCLPIQFRVFEIIKISNYRDIILPYIQK